MNHIEHARKLRSIMVQVAQSLDDNLRIHD